MGQRWARTGRPLAAGAESEGERGARPRAVGPEPRGCPLAATAGTAGRRFQPRLWCQGLSKGACRGRGRGQNRTGMKSSTPESHLE